MIKTLKLDFKIAVKFTTYFMVSYLCNAIIKFSHGALLKIMAYYITIAAVIADCWYTNFDILLEGKTFFIYVFQCNKRTEERRKKTLI